MTSNDTYEGSGKNSRAHLIVRKVWRTDGKRLSVVNSGSGGGDCGIYLQPGSEYIILGYRYTITSFWGFLPFVYGEPATDSCSGTLSVKYPYGCKQYPRDCELDNRMVTELLEAIERKAAH